MVHDAFGTIVSAIGGVLVALVTVWVKKLPERKDPRELMEGSFTTLAKRLADVEADSARQWDEIGQLRRKVDSLGSKLRRVISYALTLEARLTELTGEPHQRPDDLTDIFEDS